MIIPLFGFLILLRFIIYQVDSSGDWAISYIKSNLFVASLKQAIYLIESQTYTFLDIGLRPGNLIFRVALISGFLYLIKRSAFNQFITKYSVLIISAAFMILIYFMVIVVLRSTTFLKVYYVAFSFPLIFLCFSLLLTYTFKNDLIRILVVISYMAISYIGYHDVYNSYKGHKNLKELSLMVKKELSKEVVFVFNPKDAERINYYVDVPENKVIGVPGELDLTVYDYNVRTVESEEQIRSIIGNAMFYNAEFYVIMRESHLERNTYNSQLLHDYLNENFNYVSRENCGLFIIIKYKVNNSDLL